MDRHVGEWTECTWGDLAALEYGKGLRGYEDAKGPYRVYGTNGPIGWHDEPLCDHPGVIIGRKGAYRGIKYCPEPFYVIDTAFYLEPEVELDVRWAYYELLTHDINAMDSGSAIPSTSRGAFYQLPVKVPPLEEQRAIAHVLGTLDDKIELNQRMNETLEATARAIFKSWFVDFDPVIDNALRAGNPIPDEFADRAAARQEALDNGNPIVPDDIARLFPDAFQDSNLGPIPAGWGIASLDQIAEYLNGVAWQKYRAAEGKPSLPVIKIRELRDGFSENTDHASLDVPDEYIVEDGDVLFSWSGSLLVKLWTGGRGVLNQHLFKLSSGRYPKWFYYMWTVEHLERFQRIAADKATTMGHIKREHLSQARALLPSDGLLQAMTDVMRPVLDRQISNDLESRTLAATRDALMPRLLSGEIRTGILSSTELGGEM